MNWGVFSEAPYVYTFFAGATAALFRPLPPAAPVIAACTCECDCEGTAHWGARALIFVGVASCLFVQLIFIGCLWAARAAWESRRVAAPDEAVHRALPGPGVRVRGAVPLFGRP